ncbi:uncharacterized protein LOC105204806 [Solenopsis invicta]|uniref:uncharacterized protein LOC105204806 n=1 Tax=Solenopsis invicta TaxID=13686 RepID=UPI000595CA84|nr:uncharacterized protein LOC105204806 [Solenopsis invicta]
MDIKHIATRMSSDAYFYATVCHVCKKFGDGVSLKRCGGCRMIAYCDREHQKQHWPQHKSFCKAIQDLLQGRSIEDPGIIPKEPDDIVKLMFLMTMKLERYLEKFEEDMILYSRKCAVCHERNGRLLEDCQNCFSASFCKDHKDSIEHKDVCDALKLTFQFYISEWYVDLNYMEHIPDTNTFQNMNDFVNALFSLYEHTSNIQFTSITTVPYNLLTVSHSRWLTNSLSLFHAMQILDYIPKRKDLTIHVIIADETDEIIIEAWEILLHLLQPVISLKIVIIGLELLSDFNLIQLLVCKNCISGKKKVSVEFHKMLYEKYACSPLFVKPDLIVAFNIDIKGIEFKRVPFVRMLVKQNCPIVLLGSVSMETLELKINGLNTILNKKVDYVYKGKNPFASLLPARRCMPKLGVFYRNCYLIIYRSLCN